MLARTTDGLLWMNGGGVRFLRCPCYSLLLVEVLMSGRLMGSISPGQGIVLESLRSQVQVPQQALGSWAV